jgi:hypothetical protein
MSRLAAVRAFALFDLVVTGLLAVPWLGDAVLALMVTWFGLDGSPGDVLPLPILTSVFLNLAGVLGVLWNGRRFLAPTPDLVRWDMWGRVAVAALFAVSLVARDAPGVLWLFVATELAGAAVAHRWLSASRRESAIS